MDTRDLSHRSTRDTRSRSPDDPAHFDRKKNRSVEFSSKVVGDAQRPVEYDNDSYYRRPQSRSGERKSRSGSDERRRRRGNRERAYDSSPEDLSFAARQQAAVARGSYVAYVNYGTESGGESSGEEDRRREQSTRADRGRGRRQTVEETSPEMDRKSRTSQTSPKIGLRGKASTKEPLASVGVKKCIHDYYIGKKLRSIYNTLKVSSGHSN